MKDLYDRKRQKEAVPNTPEVIVFIGRIGSGKRITPTNSQEMTTTRMNLTIKHIL